MRRPSASHNWWIEAGPRCEGRLRARARSSAIRAALLASLTAALLGVGAGSASALVRQLANGHRIGILPIAGSFSAAQRFSGAARVSRAALVYHGGPIMPSNTNYAVYWRDPKVAPEYPAGFQSGINTFFTNLEHDSGGNMNVDSVTAQYNDAAGEFANYDSHFGGALIDSDSYPPNGCAAAPICFTDTQLRAELASYIVAHGLPTDLTHLYLLITPPGVEDCSEAAACSAGTSHPVYCAYHGFIPVGGGVIVYTNDPYVAGNGGCEDGEHPNNLSSDGEIQGGLSHEHNEAISDPELSAWYDAKGNEDADKCRTFNDATEFGPSLGLAPDGSRFNQVINSALYWFQQEWSNGARACEQRLQPSVRRVSPKRGAVAGGAAVTITGADFTSPAMVEFGGAPATGVHVNSPTSITAMSPAATAATVDVTVTALGRTSAATSKDHFKYR